MRLEKIIPLFLLLSMLLIPVGTVNAQATTVLADFEEHARPDGFKILWYYLNDHGNGGNSIITSGDTTSSPPLFDGKSYGPGYGSGGYSGILSFSFGTKTPTCGAACTYAPEVALGLNIRGLSYLNPGDTVLNLTGATALTFMAKATAPISLNVVIGTADITDYARYRKSIQVTTEWKLFSVELKKSDQFMQPSWGVQKPFNTAMINTLDLLISKTDNPSWTGGTLYLDDVKIVGWQPKSTVSLEIGKGKLRASPSTGVEVGRARDVSGRVMERVEPRISAHQILGG
jgi:hypothetical protein